MSDATQVLARVDSLRDELVATLAEAIAVRSVNPTYAGQDYNDLVGGGSPMSPACWPGYIGRAEQRPSCSARFLDATMWSVCCVAVAEGNR